MNWLEQKYVHLISPHLEKFKRIGNRFNYRCNICGDSKKSKTKTRAWIYEPPTSNKLWFHCHNCGSSLSFRNYLKEYFPVIYYDFIKEIILENEPKVDEFEEFVKKMKKPEFIKKTGLNKLKKISQLGHNHPAKKYVESREIPPEIHHKLFYAPKFKEWVNEISPDKFEDIKYDEPRLIIPLLDDFGKLIGIQGRSLKKNDEVKYITIMLSDHPKVYGLDTMNKDSIIYTFEGPIDAMFIPNSIASAGGKIESNFEILNIDKDEAVLVYDNEPRSRHTIRKIENAIREGYKVCIWPEQLKGKDINDMILSGYTPEQIKRIIDKNTYKGLKAELILIERKKI